MNAALVSDLRSSTNQPGAILKAARAEPAKRSSKPSSSCLLRDVAHGGPRAPAEQLVNKLQLSGGSACPSWVYGVGFAALLPVRLAAHRGLVRGLHPAVNILSLAYVADWQLRPGLL
jgi:hypothetical protein